jgi:transcriptional regulator GlxA family with amidase domain
MRTVGTLLFPGFELLDVYGPLEMFGALPDAFSLQMVAQAAGPVASRQGPQTIADVATADARPYDILLVPGGLGTRTEVDNVALIDWLQQHAQASTIVATVCTGAALLARTGHLDGRKATTNKKAFDWVVSQGPKVNWQRRARWVVDGKYHTSSGVSAGMDMALALIAQLLGKEKAQWVANHTEYRATNDANDDPFAALYGAGDTRRD